MQWCVTTRMPRMCSGLGLLDALSVIVEPKSVAIVVLVVGGGLLSGARWDPPTIHGISYLVGAPCSLFLDFLASEPQSRRSSCSCIFSEAGLGPGCGGRRAVRA